MQHYSGGPSTETWGSPDEGLANHGDRFSATEKRKCCRFQSTAGSREPRAERNQAGDRTGLPRFHSRVGDKAEQEPHETNEPPTKPPGHGGSTAAAAGGWGRRRKGVNSTATGNTDLGGAGTGSTRGMLHNAYTCNSQNPINQCHPRNLTYDFANKKGCDYRVKIYNDKNVIIKIKNLADVLNSRLGKLNREYS